MSEEKKEITKEEILESLGLDANTDLESFKQSLSNDWLRRENIYKDEKVKTDLHGWVFGNTNNDLKKKLKSVTGVEISKDELSSNNLEELFELSLNRVKDKYTSEIEQIKSESNSEGNEVYEQKISKLQLDLENKERLIENSRNEFEKRIKEKEEFINNRDMQSYKDRLYNNIEYSDSVNDITRRGFKAYINEKYDISKDSAGAFQITDKEGRAIENTKVIGKFYEPMELIKKEAISQGLFKTNPNSNESKDYRKPEEKKVEVKESNNTRFFSKPVGYK